MTYTFPKCGATITIETDDKTYAEKKIEALRRGENDRIKKR